MKNAMVFSDVHVTLDKSQKFDTREIEAAMHCVKYEFKSLKNCTMSAIKYNEERSNYEISSYLSSNLITSEENVIVIFVDFVTKDNPPLGISPNTTYYNYHFLLTRKNRNSRWKVETELSGY